MGNEPVAIGCNSVWCETCDAAKQITTTDAHFKRTYRGERTCEVAFRCGDHEIEREFRVNADRLQMLIDREIYAIHKQVDGDGNASEEISIVRTG